MASRKEQRKMQGKFTGGRLFRECDGLTSWGTLRLEKRRSIRKKKPRAKRFNVCKNGFLIDGLNQWDPAWVAQVMQDEGLSELTDQHKQVIDSLRQYYRKNGIAPMTRILSMTTGMPLRMIYELFPSGPGKGACRMAGLPKPTG